MGKRRTNIHKLYTELAARIVNFDNVEEIDELERALGYGVSPLPKLRQKYVKCAQQMVEIENLGVNVNKRKPAAEALDLYSEGKIVVETEQQEPRSGVLCWRR